MTGEQLILAELRSLRVDINRMQGTRLTNKTMAERLGVTTRTLYNRIQSGSVPHPGPDGTWLLAEVMEWEARTQSIPA
jgi:predicted DNA-binding transcriptional regulator AlpA